MVATIIALGQPYFYGRSLPQSLTILWLRPSNRRLGGYTPNPDSPSHFKRNLNITYIDLTKLTFFLAHSKNRETYFSVQLEFIGQKYGKGRLRGAVSAVELIAAGRSCRAAGAGSRGGGGHMQYIPGREMNSTARPDRAGRGGADPGSGPGPVLSRRRDNVLFL